MHDFPIRKVSRQEKVSWLRMARTQNVGRATFFNLLRIFENVDEALKNIEEYSRKGGLKIPIKLADEALAIKELEQCEKFGAEIITFYDPQYPKLLREIPDPPPILTIRGNSALLNKDIIAIVGPRNASINGSKFAAKIASDLGGAGLIIVSGLARGIDTSAHLGALNTGTIAVIAGGIDNIYPPENKELYNKIFESGVVISEIPYGLPPKGGNFPQRNRIISGLSLGVVIVEATLRSGTLITARFALEQNREIFAVPGSPFDPRSEGANRLIKQGAKLMESVNDILEEIDYLREKANGPLEFHEKDLSQFAGFSIPNFSDNEIDEARELILKKIGYSPITADEIISELQLPTKIANIAFVQLELADRIEYRGGKISLKL